MTEWVAQLNSFVKEKNHLKSLYHAFILKFVFQHDLKWGSIYPISSTYQLLCADQSEVLRDNTKDNDTG